MPGNYEPGSFDTCKADSGIPMGIYGTSTYQRLGVPTPSAHPAPSKSECVTSATVGAGKVGAASPTAKPTTKTSASVCP